MIKNTTLMKKHRLHRIIGLALPIIGAQVSQNILNLVDTLMVGHLGDSALAAVGLGGFAAFMFQALVLGISVGVQATASRRKGEGKISELAAPLNSGLLLVLLVAPVMSLLFYFLASPFLAFLNDDPEVIRQGVPYLEIRTLSILFVGLNFAFRGYWNGVDQPRIYMMTLMVMHVCNVLLNYILIFGNFGAPALGVLGAGLGTSISLAIGTLIYLFLGVKLARKNGFLKIRPTVSLCQNLVKISVPNGVQQLFFAAGLTAKFWIIGKIGTAELAAAHVIVTILLVAILPCLGFGLASATLVGQALGRNQIADAKQWAWDVVKVALVCIFFLGIPMFAFPRTILSLFIHDPVTLELGIFPLRWIAVTNMIEAVALVLMYSLLGAGDSKRVMKISIGFQWGLFLPVAYLVGPFLGWGLNAVWIASGSYRLLQMFVFTSMWKNEKWASIRV